MPAATQGRAREDGERYPVASTPPSATAPNESTQTSRRRTPPPRCETGSSRLPPQNVDRDVHDDPHYVYEVPIDPGHLHSEVVVRGRP